MRSAIARGGHSLLSLLAVMGLLAPSGAAHAGQEDDVGTAHVEAADPDGSLITSRADARRSLAAAQSGDVVVCEAGCRSDRSEIVYIEPGAGSTEGAAALSPISASDLIECVAGCYDTPKLYEAVAPMAAPQEAGTAALEPVLEERAPIKREPFSPVR